MKQMAILLMVFSFLFLGFTPPNPQKANKKGDFEELDRTFDSLKLNNLDTLIPYLDGRYKQYSRSGNKKGTGLVLLKIGEIRLQKAQFPAAIEVYKEALQVFQDLSDEQNVGNAYSGLGTAEGRQGNLTIASEHLITALEIYEKLQDEQGIGGIYLKLGVINVMLRNYEQGIEHYEKALTYALRTDTFNVITLYNNIGGAYLYMDSVDTSIPFFEKALAYGDKEKFGGARTLALSNLALTYNSKGDKIQAIKYYDQAIELAERHQMQDQVLLIKTNRIRILSEFHPKQAISELGEVFRQSDSLKLYSIAIAAVNQLIDLNKEQEADKNSIHWLEEKLRISSLMYDESKTREIVEVQSLYELKKSQNDILILNEKIKTNRKTNLNLGALILTLLMALIIVYRISRRKKRINTMLVQREEELEEKDKVKDRLFSIIGHDIKGGFSTQSLCLGLLEEKFQQADPETTGLLDAMRSNLNEVNHILDTLLHWGKVQIKGVYLNLNLFRVNEDIKDAFEQFTVNTALKDQTLIDLVPPNTFIFADRDHFRFILRNLLSNAIKYSFKGGRITVGIQHADHVDTTIIFIKDEGMGIKEELKDQIFKPFNKSREGTNNELGNSLALMICKEFMELNKGRIWFENNEGSGVTFFLEFLNRAIKNTAGDVSSN